MIRSISWPVRSRQTLSGDMFDSLLWWTHLTGQPPETATLVFGGDQAFTRRGMSVRPWFGV